MTGSCKWPIQATSNSSSICRTGIFRKRVCQPHHSQADAAKRTKANTVLVGISLFYCAVTQKRALKNYFFSLSEGQIQQTSYPWNMKVQKEKLGLKTCNNIFIHAILGCDTTSCLHGIGKGTSLKKVCECHHFCNQA